MAFARFCPSCLSSITSPAAISRTRPTTAAFAPSLRQPQVRQISANALKYRRKDGPNAKKRKKVKQSFDTPNLKDVLQFSLLDAMRYIRAAEVGRPPTSSKYELSIRLKTPRNGAVLRNRMRLPHPVKSDLRICVICPPDGPIAQIARNAGATLVGEDEIFEAVKEGRIEFDRCICHADSSAKLNKSGVARILGPRGLMPTAKSGTVVKDVRPVLKDMIGGTEFRERMGVIRMAIGQLAYTPEQLAENIRVFLGAVKKDIGIISDRTAKEIHEVVLSSTQGPGMSLNGEFASGSEGISSKELSTVW